jgi:4-alpha-glucanotransferase
MNRPGSAEGNWRWRVTDDRLSESAFESLRELTRASSRTAGAVSPPSITMSPEITA